MDLKNVLLDLILCNIIFSVECDHFRGAIIQWSPVCQGSMFSGEVGFIILLYKF